MEYKNRKLNRLNGFDYSSNAIYFITICVHNRICSFGNIVNCEMINNDVGKIALQHGNGYKIDMITYFLKLLY